MWARFRRRDPLCGQARHDDAMGARPILRQGTEMPHLRRRGVGVCQGDARPLHLTQHKQPGLRETNGIAERNVQSLSACVRALLERSGLEHQYWLCACRAAAFARNANVGGGGSPWRKRHQEGNYQGARCPFRARVAGMPGLTDTKRAKFAPRAMPPLYLGPVLSRGHRGRGLHAIVFI